ncbi:hypothetical protein [Halorientalis halophila]|uniref:hypothetical protein n=1 Tax=Halorientalis halophila TaxID=3108499 RepID=UPI0030084854
MEEVVRRPALQSPDRPDAVFAFVTGLYASALLAPALTGVIALTVSSDAGVLYGNFLGFVTLVTAGVAWAVTRWRGLPERLGATRWAWLLGLVPLVVAAGYFASLHALRGVAMAGFFLSASGIVVGLLLVAMTRTRYARTVVDDEAVRAEWKAGWPQPLRTRVQVGAVVLYLVGTALTFGGEFVGLAEFWWLGAPAFVGGAALLGFGQPRTYRLAPVGIERSNYVHRRLYEWDAFESFAVTDDAVVLHRSGWRPAIRCWREEIEDEDALIDALAEHLPRER